MTGRTHLIGGALAAAQVLQHFRAPASTWIPCILIGAAAALMPDVDTPGSMAGQMIPGYKAVHSGRAGFLLAGLSMLVVGPWALARFSPATLGHLAGPLQAWCAWGAAHTPAAVLWLLPVMAIAFLAVALLLHICVHHRGATHRFLFWIGVGVFARVAVGRWLDPWTAGALFAGWTSHILLDLVTEEGLHHFLWPYQSNVGLAQIPILGALAIRTGGPGERRVWHPLLVGALVLVVARHLWGA